MMVRVPETAYQVIVYQPRGLEEGVDDGGPHKSEAALF
jgi:hypothetical protein